MNKPLLSDDEVFGATEKPKTLLSDDEVFGSAPATAVPAEPEKDIFEGEGAARLLKRRGQQFMSGVTETVATVPESLAISGESADRSKKRGAEEGADFRREMIAEMEARLDDPDLDEKTKEILRQRIADMGEGAKVLDEQAAQPIQPARERDLYKAGDKIREGSEEIFGAADPRDKSFWGKFAQGAGTATGMVGTTVAAGAIGGPVAAVGVGAAQGSAMNQAQVYDEAIAAGADDETALKAAQFAMAIGATEIIPISRALKFLPAPYRGKVTNALFSKFIQIGGSAGEEAAQEFLSQFANNVVAQQLYDPERGWLDGTGEAALMGAMLGGTLGAAVPNERPTRDRQEKEPEVITGETPPDQAAALSGATAPTAPAPPDAPTAPETSNTIAPDEQAALGAGHLVDRQEMLGHDAGEKAHPVLAVNGHEQAADLDQAPDQRLALVNRERVLAVARAFVGHPDRQQHERRDVGLLGRANFKSQLPPPASSTRA